MPEELPPAYEPLFTAAGPALRYRILRDLAHRDDTYIETLLLRQQVEKLPIVRAILTEQRADGSWAGALAPNEGDTTPARSSEEAILTLCELGLADHEAVKRCAEMSLLSQLSNESEMCHLRQLLRDKLLRLLVRAGFSSRLQVRQAMAELIEEWSGFLGRAQAGELFGEREGILQAAQGVALPTSDAYDAICLHPWQEEDEEKVLGAVTGLFAWTEENSWPGTFLERSSYRNQLFRLLSKEEYLAQPERLLYELELLARLGISRDTAATRWMLEELEVRQDADGFFRLRAPERSSLPWYFPLEQAKPQGGNTLDWTFRGLLIFGLLAYDV